MDEDFIKNLLKEKFNLHLRLISAFPENRYIAECEDAFRTISKIAISMAYDQELSMENLENFLLFMNKNNSDKGLIISKFPLKEDLKKFAEEHSIFVLYENEVEIEKKEEISEYFSIDDTYQAKVDEKIERKAKVLGIYKIKSKGKEDKIYVDLNTAEIYKLDGKKISKDEYLKKVLQLPESARKTFFELLVKKTFDYEKVPNEDLSILKNNKLVKVKAYEKGMLTVIADEILSIIIVITDSFAEVLKMKQTEFSYHTKVTEKKYVVLNRNLTKIKRFYNLETYLQKTTNLSENFKPEKKNYKAEEIGDILSKTFNTEVSFSHFIYLPYYERIIKKEDKEKREQIFPIKFKKFVKKEKYYWLYNFIDKMPEVPFILFALMYASYIYPNFEEILNTFSASLIFVLSAFIIGLCLKYIFKTERRVPYTSTPIVRYGFPSLHSLISSGTIAFLYFLPKFGFFISIALVPLGFLYIYSRVKLGVHSVIDVIGGAIIGLILGAIYGYYLLQTNVIEISYEIKFILTMLLFILPIFSILYRSSIEYP